MEFIVKPLSGGTETSVSINPESDYVASGGEKDVYARLGTAYCEYHNPNKAPPAEKLLQLASVDHVGFVTPTALLLKDGCRVGEAMPFLKDTFVLCQLFGNGWRSRKKNKYNGHATDLSVLSMMLDVTERAHEAGVVLVDHNDMNWLVRKDFSSVHLIDTPSCQTKNFPATAIKPAIRDPHCGVKWSRGSDYYTIAILAIWLWTGSHPCTLDITDFPGEMLEKMKAGRWLADPKAELSDAVRPFLDMPTALLDWAATCIETKDRPEPPSISGLKVTAKKVIKRAVQSGAVSWEQLRVCSPWVDEDVCYDFKSTKEYRIEGQTVIGNGISVEVPASGLYHNDGRVYASNMKGWFEISFTVANGRLNPSYRKLFTPANIPNATVHGTGCVVQDILGSKVISCPKWQVTHDLQGHKVIEAVAHGDVAILKTQFNQKLWRVMFVNGQPDPTIEEAVDPDPPNFCVNRKGIVVENREGTLIAFHKKAPGNAKTGAIPAEMRLLTDGDRILGTWNNLAYVVKFK